MLSKLLTMLKIHFLLQYLSPIHFKILIFSEIKKIDELKIGHRKKPELNLQWWLTNKLLSVESKSQLKSQVRERKLESKFIIKIRMVKIKLVHLNMMEKD